MKITLAILALLVAFSYAANECKVFKCGSINQEEGQAQICGQKQTTEGEPDQWFGSACTAETEFCQSSGFVNPGQLVDSATCAVTPVYSWPPAWTAGQNTGRDGDYCETTADCTGDLTCDDGNNVCTGAIEDGQDCPAGNDMVCSIGSWCQADNKCGPLLTAGTECPRENACAVGHTCVGVEADDGTEGPLKCVKENSLANGVVFKFPAATTEQSTTNDNLRALATGISTACSSWNLVDLTGGKFQCRQGATVDAQTVANLDAKCTITEFVTETAEKSTESTTREIAPLCGFNKDDKAICPLMIGDTDLQKEYSTAIAAVQKLNCHRASFAPTANTQCKAWRDAAIKMDKNIFNAATIPSTIGEAGHQMHANMANNDKCIPKSITLHLWKGFGDAYLSYSVVGMFATAFAYILM